jgi:S1-C subfamily serine protease
VVQNTKAVNIILSNGSEQEAVVVGADKYNDIAVLKAEGPVPAVAALGNSDVLQPGESVIAIGSPLGDFKNTVTVGVVSATGRSIDTGEGYQVEGLVQTDAAINQGNSGGPLLNLAGEVIGVNTLIVRSSGSGAVAEGLGFAIPIDTAQAVAQIIEKGYFAHPFLGITYQPITPAIARAYDLPVQWGVYISRVAANSPASEAGLQRGDIITSVGGVALDDSHSYLNTLYAYKPGDRISLTITRGGETLDVQVTLARQGATKRPISVNLRHEKKGAQSCAPLLLSVARNSGLSASDYLHSLKIRTCRLGSLPYEWLTSSACRAISCSRRLTKEGPGGRSTQRSPLSTAWMACCVCCFTPSMSDVEPCSALKLNRSVRNCSICPTVLERSTRLQTAMLGIDDGLLAIPVVRPHVTSALASAHPTITAGTPSRLTACIRRLRATPYG